MQRIIYTPKTMRVPDRGCAARKRLELQRRLTVAAIVAAIAVLAASAIITGIRAADLSSKVEQLPSNVLMLPLE